MTPSGLKDWSTGVSGRKRWEWNWVAELREEGFVGIHVGPVKKGAPRRAIVQYRQGGLRPVNVWTG